jgi:hypothetical protein
MRFHSWRSGVVGAALGATVVAVALTSNPAAQAAGESLVLGSFISNGQCTPGTTNCTDFVTGVTSHGGGLTFRADGGTGLSGVSLSGDPGVSGHSQGEGGTGVSGAGTDEGVHGFSESGIGVAALSNSGTALSVSGKAQFSRSGTATVTGTMGAPKSSVTVTNVALTAKSLVLVTPQKDVSGVWVRAAVPDTSNAQFTVYLNKKVSVGFPVAWMVIERP